MQTYPPGPVSPAYNQHFYPQASIPYSQPDPRRMSGFSSPTAMPQYHPQYAPSHPTHVSSRPQYYNQVPLGMPMHQYAAPQRQPFFRGGRPVRKPQTTSTEHSETWTQIQKLLEKPVYFPEDIKYEPHSYGVSGRETHHYHGSHGSYGTRQNYHRETRHTEGAVLRQSRYHSQSQRLTEQQYEEYRRRGMFEEHRSHEAISAPKTVSRIEYMPYFKKYYDYEPREVVDLIYVPVEKTATEYYTVEHITDYVKQEFEETVIDYVPEETTKMTLKYLPIEQHILYIPEDAFTYQNISANANGHQLVSSKVHAYQDGQRIVRNNGVGSSSGNFGHIQGQAEYISSSGQVIQGVTQEQVQKTVVSSASYVHQMQASSNNPNPREVQTGQQISRVPPQLTSNSTIERNQKSRQDNFSNYLQKNESELPESDKYQVNYKPHVSQGGFASQGSRVRDSGSRHFNEVDSYQEVADRDSSPRKKTQSDGRMDQAGHSIN